MDRGRSSDFVFGVEDFVVDGFGSYHVETRETPTGFIVTVGLLVALLIAFAAPLACWSKNYSQYKKDCKERANETSEEDSGDGAHANEPQDLLNAPNVAPPKQPAVPASPNVADLSIFHREHLLAMKAMAKEAHLEKNFDPDKLPHSFPEAILRKPLSHSGNSEQPSAIPSVATTSRLYGSSKSRRRIRSRVPWRNARGPLARPEVVQQAVELERQSYISGDGGHNNDGTASRSRGSWGGQSQQYQRPRIVSEAAGSVLEGESVEGEAEFYRQKFKQRSRQYKNRYARNNTSSSGGSDLGSVMPPLDPDCISPEDAADANDPGRGSTLMYNTNLRPRTNHTVTTTDHSLEAASAFSARYFDIWDLAEPDYESKRILALAIPSTIGAMAEPFFRIVLVAIISHFVDTDSAVAYLIVILFIRLTTEEISGAITDTESNLLQDALMQGGDLAFFQAGQIIQLAIFVQLAVGIPILLMWYFLMEHVADWLVDNDEIAEIAATYTGVIIIDYILRGASRTFMLPFYLTGQAQFEANIDLAATVLTLIAIAIVATTNDLSLSAIGWIQVIIGIAKMITKVAYVSLRGWLQPYKQGLLKTAAFKVRRTSIWWLRILLLSV